MTSAKEARKTKDGWAAYMREYRKQRPDIMKKIDLKKNFGITLEYYYSLLENQNYNCAICKQKETKIDPRSGLPFALAVDHCHNSGKIRGLLCMKCNRALGLLEDDSERLRNAADYLDSYKGD